MQKFIKKVASLEVIISSSYIIKRYALFETGYFPVVLSSYMNFGSYENPCE